jgi:hypothetical protein
VPHSWGGFQDKCLSPRHSEVWSWSHSAGLHFNNNQLYCLK